jgi:hypothetical protein
VSRTTGRLVPLYVAREFDDNTYMPIRKLPPIDQGQTELDQIPANSDVPAVSLTMYAGDDYDLEIDLPVDLTGATVQSSIKNTSNPLMPNVPLAYQLLPFTVEIVDAEEGAIRLSLTGAQTAILSPYCTYDVQVAAADGAVTTYLRGDIRIDPQVTP